MLENLVLYFSWLVSEWHLLLVGVVLMLAGEALIEWAKPISAKRSIPLVYTREARVAAAVRAADRERRWVRLVQYSHWLEDGNPICRVHEKSYARQLERQEMADIAEMLYQDIKHLTRERLLAS